MADAAPVTRRRSPGAQTDRMFSGATEKIQTGLMLDAIFGVVLLFGALSARATNIAPPSLWLDDAWVALAARADSVNTALGMGTSFPGFVVVERLAVQAIGIDRSWSAQIIPLLAGVVASPVLYVIARRRLRRGPSALGAAFLAVAPFHVEYSARAKPFTVDALVTLILIGLLWPVVEHAVDESTRRRRWTAWAAISIIGFTLSASTATVIVGSGVVGIVATMRHNDVRFPAAPMLAGGVTSCWAITWYQLVIRQNVTSVQRTEFEDFYLSRSEGPLSYGHQLIDQGLTVLATFATVDVAAGIALLASVVVLARQRPWTLLLLASGLLATIVFASAAVVPFGTGRTEIVHHPAMALMIACAAHELIRERYAPADWAVAALGITVLSTMGLGTADYPQQDLRPLVVQLESERDRSEPVIVTPDANYAYSLYAALTPTIVVDHRRSIGFDAHHGQGVEVLPEVGPDRGRWNAALSDIIQGEPESVWVVASHHPDEDLAAITEFLEELGYSLDRVDRRPGAALGSFVKR